MAAFDSKIKMPSVSGFHAAARTAASGGGQLAVNNRGQFVAKHSNWFGRRVLQVKQRFFPQRIVEQNQRVLYALGYALRTEKNISKYRELRKLTVTLMKQGKKPAQLAEELDQAVQIYEWEKKRENRPVRPSDESMRLETPPSTL